MNTPVKSDFINVRLSDAGRAFAGANGSVRIANAHMIYSFKGTTPQRVLTSEWTKILSRELAVGKPMFELVPDAPVVTAKVPTAAAVVAQPPVVAAAAAAPVVATQPAVEAPVKSEAK